MDMLRSASLTDEEIAAVANRSMRQVRSARTNHQIPGSLGATKNTRGRRSSVPPQVLTALLDHILTKLDLYLDEIADFLWDQYESGASLACSAHILHHMLHRRGGVVASQQPLP
jgi:hypothetical protein